MTEQAKKVIIISKKTNDQMSEALREKLEAMGVEVEIKHKAPEVLALAKDMNLEMAAEAHKITKLLDEEIEIKINKKHVPKKLGNVSKAKYKKIRGKRYGR